MLHLQDIRYALRLLLRSPGFSLLTLLMLAGGLGLGTFTFSFLYTAMYRDVPLHDGGRVVRLAPVIDGRRQPIDAVDVAPLREALHGVRAVAAFGGREVLVGSADDGRVVDAVTGEPALFAIARTPPLLGRTLLPADAEDGAEPVVVLAHATWQVAFGGDPSILDTRVVVDGVPTRIVGVMPPSFGFPIAAEAWLPMPARTLAATTPDLVAVQLVGRLAPEISHERAAVEAGGILARLVAARDTSARAPVVDMAVESLPAAQIGEERALAFTALNVVAALIFLLALVNVVNLLLARANERIRETAVRLALGATTGRLVVQAMWESVLLCLAGGALGTLGAAWGLDAVTRWTRANLEGNLAFWWVWRMDRVTILAAGAFVTVAIAVLGSVVALRTTRTNVREIMQDGSARSGARHVGRLSRLLVAAQVAMVTVLMYVGVLSEVVARRVIDLDPGFPVARLLHGGIAPPDARFPTAASRHAAFRDVHARLAAHPELDGVLLRRTLAERQSPAGRFVLRGTREAAFAPRAFVMALHGDPAIAGAGIVEGRALEPADDASRAPVAVVSRALAERHWPGRSPIGDQVRLAGVGDTARWLTIVGVAADVPHGDPLSRERSAEAIYVPLLQGDAAAAAFLVRWRASETGARRALRESLAAVDPLLVPDTVQPFEEMLRTLALVALSVSRLFAACFAFALLLALVGTFGLMSRAIGLRTREVGVRRALGATDASVARLLLGQGGRQLGAGTCVAAPVLVLVGFAFTHFLPVGGWVPLAAGIGVSAAIVGLVLATSWVPTRAVLRLTLRDALWRE